MSLMKSEKSDSILVIDDDNDVLYTARLVLRGLFGRVDVLDNPGLIPEYLKACKYDAILLDMNFSRGSTSGKEGMEWLSKILLLEPGATVLTTSAYGEINLAVQAMKLGAVDFIIKPWNKEQLVVSVQNAVSLRRAHKNDKKKNARNDDYVSSGINKYPEIISRSPLMAQIKDIIKTVAPTEANVLIMGENGTGKELAAWALHKES
jgi:DNA-binding NtrC family response regulator